MVLRSSYSRRDFTRFATFSLALGFGPARLALGAVPGDKKFVFIVLRGALDGMAAAAPIADPAYARLRGGLSLADKAGLHPIAEGMVLHPALGASADLWAQGELALMHAAATPYRSRSHFDGQDVLESGAARVYGANDGWLNRALAQSLIEQPKLRREAIAIGESLPLALRGAVKAGSWAPSRMPTPSDAILRRLTDLYAGDEQLFDALTQAMGTEAIGAEATKSLASEGTAPQPAGNGRAFAAYAASARAGAALMRAENGPSTIVLSFDGWDTHFNQGADQGPLALRLAGLDSALAALKSELGPKWRDTLVIAASEFGRTAAVNGSGGTDHGTGGLAFIAGGAVKGGRFLGDWPGLQKLFEDRDLAPANDLRGLFKGALAAHWGLSGAGLDQAVFPDSADARALSDFVA